VIAWSHKSRQPLVKSLLYIQLYFSVSMITMIESPRILRKGLLELSWENMVTMEFLRLPTVLQFHLKKIRMSQIFGSSTTSIMKKCSIWWGKLTEEKRSSVGIQLAHRSERAILPLMKSLGDITHLLVLLSSELRMKYKLVFQLRHTLLKKRQMRMAIFKDNLFMFQVQLEPLKQKKLVSSISLEISRMQVKVNWARWLLINSMVLRLWLESFRKWSSIWKVLFLDNTDITTISFKTSRTSSTSYQICKLTKW